MRDAEGTVREEDGEEAATGEGGGEAQGETEGQNRIPSRTHHVSQASQTHMRR